jgi:hypothetical protein
VPAKVNAEGVVEFPLAGVGAADRAGGVGPADPLRFGEPVEQAAPERPCEVVALWQGLV